MTDSATLRRSPPTWVVVLALFTLFVALRCVHLDADPPNWIRGCFTRELYAEPPAKAHEARNFALFGQWHLNPADNYQFWRAQSPLWVYPLAWAFQAFGTDYPQLRAYSTLYAALGTLFVLLLCAEHLSRAGTIFVGLVLALDRVYFHYSRVGLVEPAVSAWLALCMLALVRAQARPRYLLLAHAAFLCALFTKQGAVFALPVVVLGSGAVLFRSWAALPVAERRAHALVWANAMLLAVLAGAYMSSDAYRRSLSYNAGHVFMGTDLEAPYQWRGLQTVLFRLRDAERLTHFFVSLRLSGPLALATLALWLVQLARGSRLSPFQLVSGGWFVCGLAAMAVLAQSELRFWTLVVPPAAVLAGAGLDAACTWVRGSRFARLSVAVLPAAMIANLAINESGLERALLRPSYKLRDAAAQLVAHLGDSDATIVGMASPQLVLGTPYKNYYVRREFNTSPDTLLRLGITHLLAYGKWDHTRVVMTQEFPGLLRGAKPELSVEFRGQKYDLYAVKVPLARYRD